MISRAIIDRCLESAGRYGAHVLTPIGSPGSYFPAGSWCFNALLGTNLNAPVVLFLAQHKRNNLLGHKTLLGVAISNTKWLHDGVQTRTENSHHQDGDILGDTTSVWEVAAFRSGLDQPCAALWDRYQGGEKLPLVFDRREPRESRLVASDSRSSSAITANQPLSLSSGHATQSSSQKGSGMGAYGSRGTPQESPGQTPMLAPPAECYTPLMESWTDPSWLPHTNIKPDVDQPLQGSTGQAMSMHPHGSMSMAAQQGQCRPLPDDGSPSASDRPSQPVSVTTTNLHSLG